MEGSRIKQDQAAGEEKGAPQYEPLQRKRSTLARVVFSGLITLGLVLGLLKLTKVTPSVILHTLRGVSPIAIITGLLLHILTYGLRSVRFRLLIASRKVALRNLFDIVAIHNLMNHVLPFRAGELTYVYLINQSQRVPLGEGLGTLVIVRIMDLIAFCTYYPLTILWLYIHGFHFPQYIWKALLLVVPFFFLLTILLVLLTWKGTSVVDLLRRWLLKGFMSRFSLIHLVFDKLEEVAMSFQHLGTKRVYFCTLVISLGILGLVYLIAYVLLEGMGYPMAYPLVILCSTLAYLGFILPIYSFGGFGTLEAGWTVGCLMAGFSKEMGMASGFSFHIIVLGYVSLMGLYGMLRLRGLRKRSAL